MVHSAMLAVTVDVDEPEVRLSRGKRGQHMIAL